MRYTAWHARGAPIHAASSLPLGVSCNLSHAFGACHIAKREKQQVRIIGFQNCGHKLRNGGRVAHRPID